MTWLGGTEFAPRKVPLPEPGPGELLVRIRLATVCGSDRHTVAGRRGGPCPAVLGHEAVGEVAGTGERIVWSPIISCGACDRCESGRTAKCRRLRKIGHEPFDTAWPLSGCYATHLLLPAGAHVAQVPDGLSDAVAAPAACATATVMAVAEAAGPLAGRRVLISGAGMLGLTAAAVAADAGAREVVVTDVDPVRLARARRFGASRTESREKADVVLELSGAARAVHIGLERLDIGGVMVLAGSVAPGPAVPLDPERLVRNWHTVTGVHNYEPRHLAVAVEFLDRTAGARPWAELVGEPRPLSELAEVLGGTDRTAPRMAVKP